MSHLRTMILSFLLLGCASKPKAQTLVGPGPDPACGGTELAVTEEKGRISLIQQTIFASNRTIVEQFRPMPSGEWQVTLLLYSSLQRENQLPTKDRLVQSVTFATSDFETAEKNKQVFGYNDIDWAGEPTRFSDYYYANRFDFKKSK